MARALALIGIPTCNNNNKINYNILYTVHEISTHKTYTIQLTKVKHSPILHGQNAGTAHVSMALALALTGVIFILLYKLQRTCDLVEAVLIASRVARHDNVI